MPFWRRNRNEPPTPEVDEPVDPALVDPDWEPDPADFGVLDDGTPVEALPDDGSAPAVRVRARAARIGHDHRHPASGPTRSNGRRASEGTGTTT